MFFTVFIIVFCTSFKHVKGKRNDSGKELYSTSTQQNDEDSQEHLNRSQNLILKDLINNMVLVAGGSFMKNMVNIEGGSFAMGCEKNYCDIDEKPLHNVKLRSFQMSKYEVTQSQWRSITGTLPQIYTRGYVKACANCPVAGVTWNDVQDFLIKLNKKTGKQFRLPTEAEWEYAARGGNKSNGYLYSGGNYLDSVAWYDGNSNMNKSVGLKKPNELGLYDMTGNVMEWCSDRYGAYYSKNQVSNTQDPVGRQYRVIRGGENKSHNILDYRITYRQYDRPDNASYGYGFRIAHDLN